MRNALPSNAPPSAQDRPPSVRRRRGRCGRRASLLLLVLPRWGLPLLALPAMVVALLAPARSARADTSWQTAPALPAARGFLAAATGADGTIYAIGGYDSSGTPQGTVYSFKPGTDTSWQTAPALPAARALLAAATGADGTLYAIGGQDSVFNFQSTVYSFKPGADTSWQTAPALPAA